MSMPVLSRKGTLNAMACMAAALAQRPSVLQGGDRAILRKHPLVAARNLARVQRARGDLALRRANLNAAPDEVRVKGVVAGVKGQCGSGGTLIIQRRSTSSSWAGNGRITWRSSISRALSVLCVRAFAFSNQTSSCS